jgi:TetR/AcrR family transcriptional repressor of nem operon
MRARSQPDVLPDTKRKLVEAGMKLMRAQGFNATSVDEICAAAGVTKGAFFHYFKSKDDLAKAALLYFLEAKATELNAAPFRKISDPLARVYGRLDFIKEAVGGTARVTRGCLVGTFAQELSFTHPDFRSICGKSISRLAEDFEKDIAEAKSVHAPEAKFDPKGIALFFVSVFQGSNLMAKASESNSVLLDNIEHFRRYLHFLFAGGGSPARAPKKQSAPARA